jgi:hypothetical protein
MPRETPEEPDGPEASSRDSSGTSRPTTTSPYIAGPGPGFDPSSAPPPPPDVGEEPDVAGFQAGWEEEQVHDWLLNAGGLGHAAFGVAEQDWSMTQADLKRIAPPLTRILNRFEPAAALAAYSDPAAVAMGFGMYGWRSALERTAVLRARARAEELGGEAPAPASAGEGPAMPEDFTPAAERLRATRPPEV